MLEAPLPLPLRAPNPPALFVGRHREREVLRSAFARGPVTLVTGVAGVGKTATVLQVLRDDFADRRVAWIAAGELPQGLAPDRELVRTVAAAASASPIAWSSVLRVRESLPELLLDIAERARLWLLIDGVGDDPILRDLMAVISRYARDSRWIVTGEGLCENRLPPGQGVRLAAMPLAEMEELARQSAPERDDWVRAARAAAGNPGALLRVHAAAPTTPPPLRDPMVTALRTLADHDAAVAAAWLDRHAERALEEGHARTLYTMLALRRHEPPLHSWWVRCAAEVGDLDAVPDSAAAQASLQDALVLLRARHAGGDVARTLDEARALRDRAAAAGDARIAGEAMILAACCLALRGELVAALALVDSVHTDDAELLCRREVTASTVLALLHRSEAALARLEAVRTLAAALPFSAQNPILHRAAHTLYQLGRLGDAYDVLDRTMTSARARSLSFHQLGSMLFLRMCIATDRGSLDEAAGLQSRLEPFVREGTLLHPFMAPNRIFQRLWRGELEGLWVEASAALQRLHGSEYQEARCWAALALLEVVLLQGEGLAQSVDDARVRSALHGAAASPLLRETLRRVTLRRGGSLAVAPRADHGVEHAIVGAIADAEAHLLRGDRGAAIQAAHVAMQCAARWGYAPREAEARVLLARLSIAEGRLEEAEQHVALLRVAAERMGSARFLAEAAWLLDRTRPECTPWTLLCWAHEAPSPLVVRAARRLLGGPAADDPVERALLDAMAARAPCVERLPGVDAPPGWGLDDARRCVCFADAPSVSFASKPLLWRLLEVLWDHGGEASKEQLVREVWQRGDYHPLRDDNRLHVSIRKLRAAIDTQPPRRILTHAWGYALGAAPVRLRATRVP